MTKILVTTDLSANSKAGIRFAAQLALKTGADLVFYNVIGVMKPTSWSDKKYKSYAEVQIMESQTKLKKFVKSVLREEPLPLADYSYISEIGGNNVVQSILNYARNQNVALICTSTRGAGAVKKLFGTVASGMITYSEIPLMVVPYNYKVKAITKVFYASDFSALKKELKHVLDFSADVNAKVVVYHYDYLLHVPENKNKLEKLIKKQEATGVTFELKRQNIENPISKHLELDIKKEKASIVVLFTKQNRNWFDRLFARSESASMAFNADIPLLIFRKENVKSSSK